ncbi:hypothetical protein BH23VER1_BH23VER1_05320 [soil metagenome]
MKLARRRLLIDPPVMAAPDIAFILIVFFLVCASVQPDSGRPQTIPRTEDQAPESPRTKTVEVSVTAGAVVLNGELIAPAEVGPSIAALLHGTTRDDDRIVVVKSSPDTPYDRWIDVTGAIAGAGGIITLQLEEKRTVTL